MSVQACAEIVARADPDRFAAAMAAPVAARATLFPIYAFNVEVSRAPFVSAEPTIGAMRLQWWRDALAEVEAGAAPRAHEVAAPLAEVIRQTSLPVQCLDSSVVARWWDLERDAFADEAALLGHIADTAGNLMWVSARALGADPGEEDRARALGLAHGIANWLRAVPAYEARGARPLVDGRPKGVAGLARTGLDHLRRATGLNGLPATPAYRAAWLTGPILALAARDPARVAQGALAVSEFRRRGTLLARAMTGRR